MSSQHPVLRRLQALVHNEAHWFQELVVQRMIILAALAQNYPVKKDSPDWLDGQTNSTAWPGRVVIDIIH